MTTDRLDQIEARRKAAAVRIERTRRRWPREEMRLPEEVDREVLVADLSVVMGAIGAALELHRRVEWKSGSPHPEGAVSRGICGWCGDVYPCPTVTAITTALEGSQP